MLVEEEEGEVEEKEEEKKEGKKDIGFDVEAGRILESSQNEVRPHEPYINQPRLLPPPLPLVFPASLKLALFIFALTVPRIARSLCRPLLCLRLGSPSWTARHGIKPRSHKALLISYFFLRHVPSLPPSSSGGRNQFITEVKCAARDINYLFPSKAAR